MTEEETKIKAQQTKILTDLYYDPKQGLTHAKKLHDKVKDTMTLKTVREFINKQSLGQLYSQSNKKSFYPITAPPHSYQADLFFMPDKRINNGHNAALTLIEITTRQGFCYPMKGKHTREVMKAFKLFFNSVDTVHNLTTDKGSEFRSHQFKALMQLHDVKHVMADEADHSKMGMIERFNRTVKALISKYRSAYKTKKYVDALPDLIHNYNNSVHSSTGHEPSQTTPVQAALIRSKARDVTRRLDKLKNINVGDRVRVRRPRGIFEKEGKRWSDEVFIVEKDHVKSFEINDDTGMRHKHYNLLRVSASAGENPFKRKITSVDVESQLQRARTKPKAKYQAEEEPDEAPSRPVRAKQLPVRSVSYEYY